MGNMGRDDHARAFQFDLFRANMLEQQATFGGQDWHEVNVDIVQKSRFDIMLGNIRTMQADNFIASSNLGLH